MRLINTTDFQLSSFFDAALPEYAILSHRWGPEEVTFEDVKAGTCTGMAGFVKVKRTCELARARGLEWAWIDTCCIDKTSSAELSEAINAMFQWYQKAKECYAYLSDLPAVSVHHEEDNKRDGIIGTDYQAFRESDWFTRGWTLQELLAPSSVLFLDASYQIVGRKSDPNIQRVISEVTGIDGAYLCNASQIDRASIAQRFCWISQRQTTRAEDMAYCLLGIFNLSMPLLYGEGRRAFMRLQSELMKQSDDESIFAWLQHDEAEHDNATGLLAEWPTAFKNSGHIRPTAYRSREAPSTLTSRGVEMRTPFSYSMIAKATDFVSATPLGRFLDTDDGVIVSLDCEDWSKSMSSEHPLGNGTVFRKPPKKLSLRMRHHAGSWCRLQSRSFDFEKTSFIAKLIQWLGRNVFADPEVIHVPQPGWNLYVQWREKNKADSLSQGGSQPERFREQRPALGATFARIYIVFTSVLWWLSEKLLQDVRDGRVDWLSIRFAKGLQSCARDLALWAWWTMGWQLTNIIPGFSLLMMLSMTIGVFSISLWHVLES